MLQLAHVWKVMGSDGIVRRECVSVFMAQHTHTCSAATDAAVLRDDTIITTPQ